MRKVFVLVLFSVALVSQAQSPTQMGYIYTLATDMTNVTVGIKDASGTLIRTIMPPGQAQNAGTYAGIWDGNTDAGTPATGGPFTITLLYGNPTYTFDGIIGNTSNNLVGYNRWGMTQEYLSLSKMTFVGSTGWVTQGYPEGTIALSYFSDTNPNSPTIISPSYYNTNIDFTDIDNDGQYLYLTQATEYTSPTSASFVTKFDGITGRPVLFSQGQTTVGPTPGAGGLIVYAFPGTTMTAIDINTATYVQPPTAIAVQTGGNILAVGHGNWRTLSAHDDGVINLNNVIKFFDKTTGATVGSNATLANPVSMAFNSAGNLWVVGTGGLSLITGPSGANTITQPIAGLSAPVAVTVNKANDHIYVLDGGTSQQLKEYDASFALVRTYGQLGGYTDCNPTVTPDRLMVDNAATTGVAGLSTSGLLGLPIPPPRSVRVESNGDVWITDQLTASRRGGAGRIQHLTPNGAGYTLVHQVLYTSLQYLMAVSHTMPTRIFMGRIEFAFNFNVPNPPGDPDPARGGTGAWQIVRDWEVGSIGACGSPTTLAIGSFINSAEQFSNGRVYVAIGQGASNAITMAELPASGTTPMRYVPGNPTLYAGRAWILARDGSFYGFTTTISGTNSHALIGHNPLTGFDGSNNPIYGAGVVVADATFDVATQPTPIYANGSVSSNYEATTGGTYAAMQFAAHNSSTTTNWPHIVGIKTGTRPSYLFQTFPEVCSFFIGYATYPCGQGGSFLSNPGPGILTEGRNIVIPFTTNGSTVTPAYWHSWEDGMFIGQFGPYTTNSYVPTAPNSIPFAPFPGFFNPLNIGVGWQGAQTSQAIGYTQNVGAVRVLAVNGDLYLFLDTEFGIGAAPISVWKMSNLASIHEFAGTGTLGQTVALTTQVF